ncbi:MULTISPECIES: hypothetical protein [unclassified Colwellia]|jgi:hypothetical protein|uniref:hypothetical protein n=1 Tax=unclassified Colwellia TaxID=196834 RepID=UPI000D36EEF1|nr:MULTISPECIES: hypothetical protein [unclassified Colwellia]AWB57766.1 hypothetical protein DBO93_09410 [Colwellia sp. Arc7-D]MBA6415943.1 hypothetical protein [Colwellia sp. 6M3]|tara:strand:- start:1326 stop:1703 length:378 start_codon:yes stop_codon:yes gene_type:complete
MKNTRKERRSAADLWTYLLRILAILGWGLFVFALIVSYYAAPESDYGLLRYHDIEIRKFWLTPLTGYLYIVLWLSALSSYFCLILDKYRSRRKSDSKHFNILLLLAITIAWVSFILVQISESKIV